MQWKDSKVEKFPITSLIIVDTKWNEPALIMFDVYKISVLLYQTHL